MIHFKHLLIYTSTLPMKRKSVFQLPLLLSQSEIANLLGITRSSWAMYSLGNRGLATKERIKLEQLIASANQVSFFKKEKLKEEIIQEDLKNSKLHQMLKDNVLKQLKFQKKLVEMQEKHHTAINTLHFLKNCKAYTVREKIDTSFYQMVKNKANTILDKNNLALQEDYKIKIEVLQFEEELLKKRLE